MTRALALLALLAGGCIRDLPASFQCTLSSQCVANGVQGTCEPTGACSFPDASCASGRRYGDLDPTGVAGTCVIVDTDSGMVVPPDLAGGDLGTTPPSPITRVGSSKVAPAPVNSQVVIISLPAGTMPGDLLLATVWSNDSNATLMAPPAWTKLANASGGNYAAAWFYKIVTPTEPNTTGFAVTTTMNGAAALVAYRNTASSLPIDASVSKPFSGVTSYNVPSVTTTHDGDMLVAMFVDTTQGASLATPVGMVSAVDDTFIYVYDELLPLAGASGNKSAGSLPGVGAVEVVAVAPAL